MTLLQPLLLEAVSGDPKITYGAQDFRNIISAIAPNNGVVLAGDLQVQQRQAGANMSVDVALGTAIVKGTSVTYQGTYILRSTSTSNVPIAASDPSNPRIDIIVAQVHDKQADGGSSYGWTLTAVAGTPAASPVAPPVPASSLLLGQVRVNANATSITTSNITDKRVLSGVGDVPKWDLYGTSNPGQNLDSGSVTTYLPFGVNQQVGVGVSNGVVTIQTPGRYNVFGCVRISGSGTCNRIVEIFSSEVLGGRNRSAGNSLTSGSNIPVGASGSFYLQAGDTIYLGLYQDSGSALYVDNTQGDCGFSGVWVGP